MSSESQTEIQISNKQARRFLLAQHHLWPPRKLKGAEGVLDYIRQVNCIQYDPINVVGQNPHLLLQSRVRNYKPEMLEGLLYKERALLDGFDKVMSIYPKEDWPYFAKHREYYSQRSYPAEYVRQAGSLRQVVLDEIRKRGPLSSIDLDIDEPVDWSWGTTRAGRAALEMLFFDGEIVVHHRVGTRRYFELSERMLPKKLHQAVDPHASLEDYQDWHILRRVGGLGLAHPQAGEQWGGMLGTKSKERKAALERLVERSEIVQVSVEGLETDSFYIRQADVQQLDNLSQGRQPKAGAAIIAALDNLMWDRKLIRKIFDFDYIWEVYKPEAKRKYGYYVLPIIYGDRFVARFEPGFNRKTGEFAVINWWWEDDVDVDNEIMQKALQVCFKAFTKYLRATDVGLGEKVANDRSLQFLFAG
jgi:uncharacterized protein YcaQ